MRIIEQSMNNAIKKSKDWSNSNTKVVNKDGVSLVYLFDNLIAEIGDTFIKMYDGGHKTKTTKSRLNAILQAHGNPGDKVYQKNGDWFIHTDGLDFLFKNGWVLA